MWQYLDCQSAGSGWQLGGGAGEGGRAACEEGGEGGERLAVEELQAGGGRAEAAGETLVNPSLHCQ